MPPFAVSPSLVTPSTVQPLRLSLSHAHYHICSSFFCFVLQFLFCFNNVLKVIHYNTLHIPVMHAAGLCLWIGKEARIVCKFFCCLFVCSALGLDRCCITKMSCGVIATGPGEDVLRGVPVEWTPVHNDIVTLYDYTCLVYRSRQKHDKCLLTPERMIYSV